MSVVLFSATDGANGTELWSTDGTAGHTGLVKDIRPGIESSQPAQFVLLDGVVYYAFYDASGSPYLGRSDGSGAGTSAVTSGNFGYGIDHLTAANGALYFAGGMEMPDGTFGSAIFRSDGTTAGTVALTTGFLYSAGFVATDDAVFFEKNDGALWATNGTAAGTHQVLVPNGSLGYEPQNLTAAGSQLFFEAEDSAGNSALWASDGTAAGTRIVLDNSYCFNLIAVGDKVFFSRDTTNVWVSDGTAGGTFQVTGYPQTNSPTSFVSFAGKLYFIATDEGSGTGGAVYTSDGTTGGTQLVHDAQGAAQLTVAGSKLYFFGNDPTNTGTPGVWVSDGTAGGTRFLKDLPETAFSMTAVGSKVFFVIRDDTHGDELWASDGTAAGTGLVMDINPGGASSNPTNITNFNGRAIFTATTASGGTEVWISDGTSAGTQLVRDIYGGTTNGNPNSSNPYGFIVLPSSGAVVGFDDTATFTSGSGVRLTGTVTDGDEIGSVKIYDGSTYIGTATVDTATNTWSFASLPPGTYNSLKVIVTDVYGATVTGNARFRLRTGIAGQAYVAIESDYAGTRLVDESYYRSTGALYERAFYATNGTRREVYYGVTGQAYTSYEADYTSGNVLSRRSYYGYTGRPYITIEYDYDSSGASVVEARYLRSGGSLYETIAYSSGGRVATYYGVTGKAYTSYALRYDSSNVLVSRTEYGYTGQAYVSVEYDYSSSGATSAKIYRRADNSLYEKIAYSTSGQTVSYYGITGQAYTSYQLVYDTGGTLTIRREYGYTGQAYTLIEYDYNASGSIVERQYVRSDRSLYETITYSSAGSVETFYGITGKPYTTAEYDLDADGRTTQAIFRRSNNSIYEKAVFNADGSSVDTYYGVTGQAYTSYSVYFNASGTATLEKLYGFRGEVYTEEDIALDSSGSPSSYKFLRADRSVYETVTYLSAGTGYAFALKDADYATGQSVTYDLSSLNHAGDRLVFNAAAETSASFIVTGTSGADRITTGGGADTVTGGAGNDTLAGGGGTDTFAYHAHWGLDTIDGFTAGNAAGHDRVQIDKTLFANYSELMAHTIDSNGSAVITYDAHDRITLDHVTKAHLTSADFAFK